MLTPDELLEKLKIMLLCLTAPPYNPYKIVLWWLSCSFVKLLIIPCFYKMVSFFRERGKLFTSVHSFFRFIYKKNSPSYPGGGIISAASIQIIVLNHYKKRNAVVAWVIKIVGNFLWILTKIILVLVFVSKT